ncbi:MAG: NUDIX domain-containing protein [Ktedonobacteraceae bacterium]|nr:NUDIX domain-containing protein [Ktedonobacteraceae bacterium]
MTTQPQLQQTHVVTCFLQRIQKGTVTSSDPDAHSGHILIVQRSQHVGSYRGRWAGISGFVEPNVTPDEQAYTEIREETTLQGEQVRMLKRGAVVEYSDEELGRHFYIHPFLFEVLTPDSIQTDYEATQMRWIDPSELGKYETVPRLLEVYESAINGEDTLQE